MTVSPYPRVPLLWILPLALGLSMIGPAQAADCQNLMARADQARQARDADALKLIASQVRDTCQSARSEQEVRHATAAVLLAQLIRTHPGVLESPGAHISELLEVLEYNGDAWLANALLGDFHRGHGRHGEATRRYQQAIDALDALPEPSAALLENRENIYRKAELARLAAASGPRPEFIAGTTGRSGQPGGLNAPRGIKVAQREDARPPTQAACQVKPASGRSATRGAVVAAVAMPIRFEFDSTQFTALGARYAEEAVTMIDARLAQEPGLAVRLVGHTDRVGSDTYNDALSLRRAEAMRGWLSGRLATAATIDVAGCGKRIELDLGTDLAAQRFSEEEIDEMHRRVEVEFLEDGRPAGP